MSAFKPWSQHVYETVVGDKKLSRQMLDQCMESYDDLGELIFYHGKQYALALEAGESHFLWDELWRECKELRQAIFTESVTEIAGAAYRLGVTAGKLEAYIDPESLMEAFSSRAEKATRELPLKKQAIAQGFIKDLAQEIASRIWREDTGQTIRLADACEMVWPELVDVSFKYDVNQHLPENSASLKKWLREIAPGYAKKPGRPKK